MIKNDIDDSHGTFQISDIFFFNICNSLFFFFFFYISRPWMEETHSQSHPRLSHKDIQCCPVLTEHIWQTARSLESCSSSESVFGVNRFISPTRRESRGLPLVPAKRWWPATISFWFLGSAAQLTSFHTSITTVSFRCLGSFARCGFSVRVCQTSTWKKRRRGLRKSADSGKCWGINNEWTGCYAWINTAQMQVVGRAKLSHVRPKTRVDIVWIKSADSWYFVPKNFLCVSEQKNVWKSF